MIDPTFPTDERCQKCGRLAELYPIGKDGALWICWACNVHRAQMAKLNRLNWDIAVVTTIFFELYAPWEMLRAGIPPAAIVAIMILPTLYLVFAVNYALLREVWRGSS